MQFLRFMAFKSCFQITSIVLLQPGLNLAPDGVPNIPYIVINGPDISQNGVISIVYLITTDSL